MNSRLNSLNFDVKALPTPCYIIDEELLRKNLEKIDLVQQKTGCKILLAQKAFSMFSTYPLIGRYLKGTTASSLHEAKLGYEEMGGETHIFAPAYLESEFDEIMHYCDHIVFNSFAQWSKYRKRILSADRVIECGIRINPEYSEIETPLYNPCFTYSRLGVTLDHFHEDELEGIDGIHLHTLCEQNADTLARTIAVIEDKFGHILKRMKWINFGGGHHITRDDYDIDLLIETILAIKNKYNLEVYLEPGEAVALNTGFLVSSVLDLIDNGIQIAILDASAACHMPDVLEMPYRPYIIGSAQPNELPYTYRFGGNTCLAGDIIGDYSFEQPLTVGDRLVFTDMAIYSMVKNNTFNGINLPSILRCNQEEGVVLVRQFGYEDFKNRLS